MMMEMVWPPPVKLSSSVDFRVGGIVISSIR